MSTPAISGLKGSGYRAIQSSTKTPQQMDLYNRLIGGSSSGIDSSLKGLSGIASGDQSQFDALEAPAFRQFNQLQGGIASRFSGMGSGARRSSGHQNAQSGAATDFAERLQGQRLGLQQKAWEQLLGMGSHLFDQNLFETSFIPKKKKWYEDLISGLGGAAGNALGTSGGFGLGNNIYG